MAVDYDVLIIGAGVVGLAVARAAALSGLSTLVLERNRAIGTEVSSRNSEVIHAGIYYPQGSLKARCCVAGRDALYAFAANAGVGVERCGKLIVANGDAQLAALAAIREAGLANGVRDLRLLEADELRRTHPELRADRALLSPSTGIVDSHALMHALLGEASAHGAELVLGQELARLARHRDGWAVFVAGETAPALTARNVVNAAGLSALWLAARFEGYRSGLPGPSALAKGSYFSYAGATPFRQLVYPVPEPGGLGIHLTLDLAHRARFGPNVEWVTNIDYDVDEALRPRFAEAIRGYWPDVEERRLIPDYAGIRPKIVGPGEPAADFLIETSAQHGLEGIVNLLGIESPGLTASLALADLVIAQLATGHSGGVPVNGL